MKPHTRDIIKQPKRGTAAYPGCRCMKKFTESIHEELNLISREKNNEGIFVQITIQIRRFFMTKSHLFQKKLYTHIYIHLKKRFITRSFIFSILTKFLMTNVIFFSPTKVYTY